VPSIGILLNYMVKLSSVTYESLYKRRRDYMLLLLLAFAFMTTEKQCVKCENIRLSVW
jgi:hypothetical protein